HLSNSVPVVRFPGRDFSCVLPVGPRAYRTSTLRQYMLEVLAPKIPLAHDRHPQVEEDRSRRIRQGRNRVQTYISAGYPEGGVAQHQAHRPGMGAHRPFSCARFLPARLQAVSLLCMVLGPLLVWWACKILKLTAGRAAYAGALSIFYWWSSDLSEIAVTNGSVEFQITATGSLVVIADFLSFCETRASAPAAIALLAISTLCLWLHRSRSPSPLPSNRVCVISATDVPAKNRLSCLMELATESAERRFLERVSSSSSSNARFLEALASVQPTHQAVVELDRLSRGRIVGHKRIARFNPLSPDNARLFAAALHGRQLLSGFRNRN